MNDIIETKNQELIQNVTSQISSINNFISWADNHLQQSRREETFKKLVNVRRQLKRLRFSLESNPAIAAFGESQKGKSYVISSLLARKGQQFMVNDPKTGETYNFVEQLNPITRDTEATGVATRFTKVYEVPNDSFPIMVKVLSIADMLQILCDTAYNDVKSHSVIDREDIDEFMIAQERRYKGSPNVQDVLDEDDIMNVREYVEDHIGITKAKELLDSRYFDVLARIIPHVQPREWPQLMSKLWYDNSDITSLFIRMLQGYETLGFSKKVYIPISALLNTTTTLMSSLCLQKLDVSSPTTGNVDPNMGTDLFTEDQKIVEGFSKSVLSSIAAEVVFQIPKETIAEELIYNTEGILDDGNRQRLLSKGWNKKVSKEFLNTVDIFDFPGARAALELQEEQIKIELNNKMMLRGKVRYLFNKYSDERLINVLMLCHDHMQNGPTVMPGLVEQWIKQNMGASVRERTAFLDKSIVSPLFMIATKFNMDMSHSVQSGGDDQIEKRWEDRYQKVLYEQVLQADSLSWFKNWTERGGFKNTYLLRDYKWSGINGNRLFEGFETSGIETTEIDTTFHQQLRQSFVTSPYVNTFFEDPELAWDAAATMNNDGATRIIENLGIVAANAKESRLYKYISEVKGLHAQTLQLMVEYYHDENDENVLQKAISRSGAIVAEFDVVCGKDNYFFGRMIQNLQVSENYVFDFYYNQLNNTKMIVERDMKEYDLILSRCHGRISASNSYEDNLEILRQEYHYPTVLDCKEFFENVKGISLEKLFECNFKQKSNSEQLAEGIIAKWIEDVKAQKNLKFYEAEGCNTLTVLDMIENIKAVVDTTNLTGIIAKTISPFVDAINAPHQILDMIADTTAEIINEFVVTFGYNYYSPEKIADLKLINEKNNLHLSFDYGMADKVPMSNEELSDLFDDIRPTEENTMLTSLPSFINYNKWIDLLLISFIASYNVPTMI
ncbi:MAG: putative virulence factor [Prevotellaceae bacterium]|nr:putative virulence factor [Prevotellaceae bacterium]